MGCCGSCGGQEKEPVKEQDKGQDKEPVKNGATAENKDNAQQQK